MNKRTILATCLSAIILFAAGFYTGDRMATRTVYQQDVQAVTTICITGTHSIVFGHNDIIYRCANGRSVEFERR